VETEAHFWYIQPACPPRDNARFAGRDHEEATKRVLHRTQHTKAITNVAILNPNHKEGAETPRYAAIRLSEVIGEEDQARLSKLIDALKDVGSTDVYVAFSDNCRPAQSSTQPRPTA
jgi:hypothetical protein